MWTGGQGQSALRNYVLQLARRGEIASLDEAATIASVSRDTVRRWLVLAGVDWKRVRLHRIAKLATRANEIKDGKPARAKLTKAQMRAIAERAVRAWTRKPRSQPSPQT